MRLSLPAFSLISVKKKKKTLRNSHVLFLFPFLIHGKEKMVTADSSPLDPLLCMDRVIT